MTQKELLYIKDAIDHETSLIEICNLTIDALENEELQTFISKQLKKHEETKEKLMKALKETANE